MICRNICWKYATSIRASAGVVTANDVCMSVEPGQIRGLIGPNGAGKTTLLNLISGIYDVDGGNIFFNGKDVTKLPTHVRAKMGIGRTFQSPRFMNRASIEDNLKVGTDLLNQFGYIQSFFGKKGHDFMKNLEELMEIAGFTFDWPGSDHISSVRPAEAAGDRPCDARAAEADPGRRAGGGS